MAEREGHPEDAWERLEPLREHEDPGIRAEAAQVALSAGHAEIAQAGAESLLRDTAVPTIVHRRAAFVRARALEAQDQLDLAWNAYVAANRIGARPFNPDAYDEYVNQIIAAFPSRPDEDQEPLAEDVVLVVGSPRTGSSLLERILDAHADVQGLGEISLGGELLQHLPSDGQKPWFSRAHNLSAAVQTKLRDLYFHRCVNCRPTSKNGWTKTSPTWPELACWDNFSPGPPHWCANATLSTVGCRALCKIFPPLASRGRVNPITFAEPLQVLHWLRKSTCRKTFVCGGESAQRELIDRLGLDWDPACVPPTKRPGYHHQFLRPSAAAHARSQNGWGDKNLNLNETLARGDLVGLDSTSANRTTRSSAASPGTASLAWEDTTNRKTTGSKHCTSCQREPMRFGRTPFGPR